MGKIVQAIQEKVAAATLPNRYTTSLEGAFQAQGEASRTIGLLSLLFSALVFALLYNCYRSVVFTLIILGSISSP
jgi:multidrug efflux pump subunit AcrB